jgi:homoserine trans-succinylase
VQDQELVFEIVSQPPQRRTRRGLTEMHAFRRSRYTALFKQDIESDQEIEIKAF